MVSDPELDGCDSSKFLLTPFSPAKRRAGRPQRISNEVLQCARGELLFILEESWALIGWELQNADTTADIRAAFRRIKGINCSRLEPLRQEYRRETIFSQLQAARKRLQLVSGKLRQAHSNWKRCKDAADLAQLALRQIGDRQDRKELRLICQEAETALAQTDKVMMQLKSRSILLERVVQQREAAFAQSEVLDFIRSDRYASSPLSFANAMAGLPTVHWRQSMARCLSLEDGVSHGLNYRRFQVVADVMKHPAANADEAIERMKARLLQARGRDVKPLNALAENWHFLRSAIESVFQTERLHKEALPYRVYAEFQNRLSNQGAADILLAEKESITTPAFVKERRGFVSR